MTESEPSFLQLCEEEFKDRYTENDEEFMKVKQADIKNPPIVDDNYKRDGNQRSKNRFHNDRNRHNQNWRGHGSGGGDQYRDRNRGGHYYDGPCHQLGYRY